MTNIVKVKDKEIGNGDLFTLIAGPCAIEKESTTLEIARRLKDLTDEFEIPFVFKASYDKANRTDLGGYRGPGCDKGLSILSNIGNKLNISVTSDVHNVEEIDRASKVLDLLQVPAALCKQIDFVIELARSGKPINIKKGTFIAAWEMNNIVKQLKRNHLDQFIITERGNFFGYQTMVTDFRNIKILKQYGQPIMYDAGHSQQLPVGIDKTMEQYTTHFNGPGDFMESMACAGIAVGADGIFMESHIDPSNSLSDGAVSFDINNYTSLLKKLIGIRRAIIENN